ncbi:MAG: hypothetical protein BWK79_02415 [Beggiatoa sp. IS2]|nr:MAG: hypothetical protein BWK79_02415 [Beggiatoa sp. IS2]
MNIIVRIHSFILRVIWVIVLASCATAPPPVVEPPKIEPPKPEYIQVAQQDAENIGQKIWMNEGSGKVENLTFWSPKEAFPSLGIGHFIWYPKGQEGPFKEQFPSFLQFLEQQKVTLPAWLQNAPDCPWNTRDEFQQAINGPQIVELRNLLKDTIPQQVQFIIRRLELALPEMLQSQPTETKRQQVREQFYQLTKTPKGIFALLDYINFKGEGISPKERYQDQGWGLLQVFEGMPADSKDVVNEFADAAIRVLTRRVKNAPRDESQWLEGWTKRINGYR